MDEKARRRKRQLAELAAVAAFFAVLLNAQWIVHGASLLIFRLDPGAVPETFSLVYRSADERYELIGWDQYPAARAEKGFRTFRLPEPAGSIRRAKVTLSFEVLEDDGARQIVEVRYDGLYHAVSRYAAYADRVVPIAYRSLGWGHEQSTYLPAILIALALGVLAAWGAYGGAVRLTRLQRT